MIKEINDEIFGKLKYDYGWTKKDKINLDEKSFEINIVVSADEGEAINDFQRKNYNEYESNRDDIEIKIKESIRKYCEENQIEYSIDEIVAKELVFKRDGSYGLLLDCSWDIENGIVVCLEPRIEVGAQDIFI